MIGIQENSFLSDKFLALTNQWVYFSGSVLSFILVPLDILENNGQHCFDGTLVFSVLQRGMHWYKIKFPKKVNHHSPSQFSTGIENGDLPFTNVSML